MDEDNLYYDISLICYGYYYPIRYAIVKIMPKILKYEL
jgi:hypothetical protein